MKAYLDFQGFTRMIDIPRPMLEILLPIMEGIDITSIPGDVPNVKVLRFYRNGELYGCNETILKYVWDGILPKGRK